MLPDDFDVISSEATNGFSVRPSYSEPIEETRDHGDNAGSDTSEEARKSGE